MSEPHAEIQNEQRSKIKLTRNAKGDTQIEVSIVQGTTVAEADELRQLAVDQYKQIQSEFYGRSPE